MLNLELFPSKKTWELPIRAIVVKTMQTRLAIPPFIVLIPTVKVPDWEDNCVVNMLV